MARKRKPATIVDDDGYITDGMYHRHSDPIKLLRTEPLSRAEREQALQQHNLGWAERIAGVREWLTKIMSPYWEGPFQFEQVYRVEKRRRKGHNTNDVVVRIPRNLIGEIVHVAGAGSYRLRNEDVRPEWTYDVIQAFQQAGYLEILLTHGHKLDWIVRGAIELGQTIERIQSRALYSRPKF